MNPSFSESARVKHPYRVIEPIKYGDRHYTVDDQVVMEEELGDDLCDDGVLEPWPESDDERAARLNAELQLQADRQKAEIEKAERELAEKQRLEREQAQRDQDSTQGQDSTRSEAGGDDASQSESRDSKDVESGPKEDGTGADAADANEPKSEGGTKKKSGKK